MPSINMIAPRRAEKLRLERDMRRLMVVIVAELVCAVGLAGWVGTTVYTTNNRIADLDVQIAKLQPVVKEINDYENASTKLQPKLKLLNQAKYLTMRWYTTLDKLTESLPSSTYLTKVGSTGSSSSRSNDKDAEKVSILIHGVSASQTLVGETMLRIQTIPDLKNVNLHYTRDTSIPECPAVPIAPRQKKELGTALCVEFEIGTDIKLSDTLKGAKNERNQS